MADDVTDETVVEDSEVKADAGPDVIKDDEVKQDVEASAPSTETEPEEKKDGFQKRIDEKTREAYEAKAERDYWRNLAQQKPQVQPAGPPLKTLADFDYDEAKFTQYVTEKAQSDAEQKYANETARQSYIRKESNFRAREAEFAKSIDDYKAVAHRDMPVSNEMAAVLMESEKGPEILYHIGKTDGLAERLVQLSTLDMAREIGKIEANISTAKPVSLSKTPPPPRKIAAVDAQTDDGPGTSQKQFEKWRERYISMRT